MDGVGEFYRKHTSSGAEQFEVFWKELKRYGMGTCSGCRSREHHQCSIKDCFILDCVKEHHVDFCGECEEFPCGKPQKIFEKEVYIQWLAGNEEIKASGVEKF